MERFRMSPSVPSGPCSTTSTTAWRKFGSSRRWAGHQEHTLPDRRRLEFHPRQSRYRMQDGQESPEQEARDDPPCTSGTRRAQVPRRRQHGEKYGGHSTFHPVAMRISPGYDSPPLVSTQRHGEMHVYYLRVRPGDGEQQQEGKRCGWWRRKLRPEKGVGSLNGLMNPL